MGYLSIANAPVAEMTDDELLAYLNEGNSGYGLRAATTALWLGVWRVMDAQGPPMTVRGLFYSLEMLGLVPRTEAGYRQVCYQVLHSAAETLRAAGKPCYIYYFGDLDPSGWDISENLEAKLRNFGADFLRA